MLKGFLRVASCVPLVSLADASRNIAAIRDCLDTASRRGAAIAVFPELSATGYTCADLFHNSTLYNSALESLATLLAEYKPTWPAAFIGMPVMRRGKLYNCAVAVDGGRILAVVPKTYLPSYNEFYEKRWFSAAPTERGLSVELLGQEVPFGTDIIIRKNGVGIGVELCEDLWAPIPPSTYAALAGAQVVVNLSASDDVVGKFDYLQSLVAQQSARSLCAYVYASAGYGESSTDLVFHGKAIVAENGHICASRCLKNQNAASVTLCDVNIASLDRDRMHLRTWGDAADRAGVESTFRYVEAPDLTIAAEGNLFKVNPHPFVPADKSALAERCEEILAIQSGGLRRRLDATRCGRLVVGISGGLDSTLALLVAVRTLDAMGLDRSGITGVTMPGFGTTDRTYDNAMALMKALGITIREISIVKAVNQHFEDIGHDPAMHDVTYENSQARQRTLLLMDIANQVGGLVLGTGDLSELALGWATYNGDHMSMYGVNAGVPKTLVRYLVEWFAFEAPETGELRRVLLDIAATPVSPELLPPTASGEIAQVTEDLVGPYELHDFFLYHTLRFGSRPSKIFRLARQAFDGEYDDVVILKWLRIFFRRFFAQQFKRSCLPDGPKVGSVCLSPRGDWRMPSDASAATWLKEIDELDAKHVRILILGDVDGLPEAQRKAVCDAMERTKDNTGLKLNIALNYGGHAELIRAARNLAQKALDGELKPADINEERLEAELYTHDLPPVDLLIRTSGEMRTSNFLPWQTAYAEMVFDSTLWPDYDRAQYLKNLREYAARSRRFGGVNAPAQNTEVES